MAASWIRNARFIMRLVGPGFIACGMMSGFLGVNIENL